MKKYSFFAFAMLILVVSIGSCTDGNRESENNQIPEAKNPSKSVLTDNFQSILDSIYQANSVSTGIMVHLESSKHEISWSGSAGYPTKDKQTALDPDQPVLIASNIKTYVAAAILRLQEDGLLNIEDPISDHLPEKTKVLFSEDGYDFEKIRIKHLLSHTSGIADYVNDDYFEFINNDPKYRWTRDEQLELAVAVGDPLGEPGAVHQYADVNYLLATEIIEQLTEKPFYTSMRELLKFDELGLTNTWFPTLEEKPASSKDMAHQYWNEENWGASKLNFNWDSYEHDVSWDLYGGGGIATTVEELSRFSHLLHTGKIINDPATLNLITTDVPTSDGKSKTYRLGIADARVKGLQSFGHGGFWGTMVFYIPALETSISVCVLERNQKMKSIRSLMNALTEEIGTQVLTAEVKKTDVYHLYKANNAQHTLVLYPGAGTDAEYTRNEFDIVQLANSKGISVLMMNVSNHLWLEAEDTEALTESLNDAFESNGLNTNNVIMGGMSIGGNMALTLSDHLIAKANPIQPKGVFVIDSPVDLYALYESALFDINNQDLDEERLAEPKFIIDKFESEFGEGSVLDNIQRVSPFVYESGFTSVPHLRNCNLRFYIEPDADWWMENRQTIYENTNACVIQKVVKNLEEQGWRNVELIETQNKGYRSNGERHPHSWSIADMEEMVEWIVGME